MGCSQVIDFSDIHRSIHYKLAIPIDREMISFDWVTESIIVHGFGASIEAAQQDAINCLDALANYMMDHVRTHVHTPESRPTPALTPESGRGELRRNR